MNIFKSKSHGFYALSKCDFCRIEIKIRKSRLDIYKNFFCSRICATKWKQENSLRGDKSSAWRGGKIKHSRGYTLLFKPDHPKKDSGGYVPEHVVVMEEKIGRFLYEKEIVHHINHIKHDNNIDNLYLCEDRKEHNRIHSGWKKIEGVWFKICKSCKRQLEVSEDNFYKRKSGIIYFFPICKKCCADFYQEKKRGRK